ncbi:unnamed protein product [Ilex paraguariensis]|uniref:Protein kinase domain-containing protein n=1 Tax=Ilex paraguariensis TaxID=185542 RepID=A0ABC8REI5_9AQUA
MNMVSAAQKKTLHTILATKLSKLTIPPANSSSSSPDQDFDFSELFGPLPSSPHPKDPSPSSPSSSPSLFLGDPQIIHNRSHSFIGPSPRFTLSKSLPFHQDIDDSGSESGEIEGESEGGESADINTNRVSQEAENREEVSKIGPVDFEILRVIGKGAFGKVFQVRKKDWNGIGDGIFAMKVMRKDTIIKNNHVDYMKAERDILTKVVHPFIVQLRYSFQVKCYSNQS